MTKPKLILVYVAAAALLLAAVVHFIPLAEAQDPPADPFARPPCADLAAYVADLGTLRGNLLGGGTRNEIVAAHAILGDCIDAHGLRHRPR